MLEGIIKWILYFFTRMLSWTYRYEGLDFHHFEEAKQKHPLGTYILAFWHEHLLFPLFYLQGRFICTLTSESKDGRIIAFVVRKFGYDALHGSPIRGGKDKGGLRAIIGLLGKLKSGIPIAVTVDGSIGPRHYVKAGVIDLARKSGAWILPVGCTASSYWTLNTWDQFKIPKPFSKIILHFSEPISVPEDFDKKEIPSLQEKIKIEIKNSELKTIRGLEAT